MDFGLSSEKKSQLINLMKRNKSKQGSNRSRPIDKTELSIPDNLCDFSELPGYKKMTITRSIAEQAGISQPFFLCHEGVAKGETIMENATYLNFSTYDYLDLNGDPRINAAAAQAMEKYGTSASASRISSGERPPHRELEKGIAAMYGVEDCITYVSGHATNVWTIAQLFNRNDLTVHDSLSHNSIIQGCIISGAHRIPYPHNDLDKLEEILAANRTSHKRAVIITEGLFSMDGDLPDMKRLIEIKKHYKCFLMVDEAHSLGVLGKTGRGVCEHCGVDPRDVDILMGTLSKTLCGCGGYIAGNAVLVEYLKYNSPGFVYSVGMPPPIAAASTRALEIMLDEPERVERVQEMGRFCLEYSQSKGLQTGTSQGFSITPVIVGNSLVAGMLASAMQQRHVNVGPVIYPSVEDSAARLRFFITASHTREQIADAIDKCAEELPRARRQAESYTQENLT